MSSRKALTIVAIAMLALGTVARGAIRTWNGNTDANWGTAANWNEGALGNNTPVFGPAGTSGTTLNNNTVGTSSSGITFNDSASAFTINGNSITLNGNITVGTGVTSETINLPMTLSNNRRATVNSGTLTLGGVLSQSGSNRQLDKRGLGTLVLTKANTYTGLTRVTAGTLIADGGAGASLASTELRLGVGGDYDGGGTFIYDNTSATGATSLTLPSLQLERALPNDNVIQVTRTAPHNVTLTFTTLQSHPIENGHNINFVVAGPGVVNGTNAKIVLGNQTTYRITGQNTYFNGSDFGVYDTAGGFVRGINYGVDAGSATSAGGASFVGTTHQEITGSITAQPAVTLGATSSGNSGTLKIVGASDITMNGGAQLKIQGPGNNGSFGILKTGGGTSTIGGGAGSSLRVSRNAQSSYRVDGPTDVLNIAIPLSFTSKDRFMKSGEGKLIISSDIVFTDSRNPLWINGGIAEIGGSATMTKDVSSTIIASGAAFRYNSSSLTSTHAGLIQGWGGVAVNDGALTLSRGGGNAYTGGTTISGGTLLVTNTSGSGTGTGAVTIDGGALGGTGSLSGPITVNPGGAVSPGLSVGTLSGSNLTWNSNDSLAGMSFELSSIDNTSDLLALSGAFTKGTGSSFLFDFLGGKTDEIYTLISFDSTTFTEPDFGVASGIDGSFRLENNTLLFDTSFVPGGVIPEPSTFAIWALGLLALGWYARRRMR